MKVTVDRSAASEVVLNVELDWAEVEKASERAYRKLAQQYSIPGFRRGHAPRSIIERTVGKDAIYQEGIEELMDSSYRSALRENNLRPLAPPTIDSPTLEHGQSYAFTARFPVQPPVSLGDYRSIRMKRTEPEVTEEDIQRVVERVQQSHAMWLPAERAAAIGDQVTVDLRLTVGDRTISDLHDNEFELAEERVGLFFGMDAQIVGMSEGESKSFTTQIPEDYANTELAGKEAAFEVTVKAVKFRELPEVDDELARSVGQYENLDEMRIAIRMQYQEQREHDAQHQFQDAVIAELVKQTEVEIHPVLIEREIDDIVAEMRRMLSRSGMTLDDYLESVLKKTEAEYRDTLKDDAAERAKRSLALRAVADAEDIQVSDDDIRSWLRVYASATGNTMKLASLSSGQRDFIVNEIRQERAVSRLVELATQDDGGDSSEAATPADAVAEAETASADASPAND